MNSNPQTVSIPSQNDAPSTLKVPDNIDLETTSTKSGKSNKSEKSGSSSLRERLDFDVDSPEFKKILFQDKIKKESQIAIQLKELKRFSEEMEFYSDENATTETVLFNEITKIEQDIEYLNHIKSSFQTFSKLLPQEQIVDRLLKDALKRETSSIFACSVQNNYEISQKRIIKYEDETTQLYEIESQYKIDPSKGLKELADIDSESTGDERDSIFNCFQTLNFQWTLEEQSEQSSQTSQTGAKSEDCEGSKELLKAARGDNLGNKPKKAFKLTTNLEWNTEELLDLPVNDALFEKVIGDKYWTATPKEIEKKRTNILNFFSHYTISDELRSEGWRKAIGNKLKINKTLFECLKKRLDEEGISKKTEKTITNDLDRTSVLVGGHTEGQIMYSQMKMLLSLFELYRPDIGYIQGMGNLLVLLYYYYDQFETFVLFTNLIVCNKFVRDMFRFDLNKIKSYCEMFNHKLEESSPKLYNYLDTRMVVTMTLSVDWYFTLLSRAFDVTVSRCVWDCFFILGQEFIVNCCVSIVKAFEKELYQHNPSEGYIVIKGISDKLKLSTVMNIALKLPLDSELFEENIENLYEANLAQTAANNNKVVL